MLKTMVRGGGAQRGEAPRAGRAHGGRCPSAGRERAAPYWLYGLHPVAAALGNPARRLRRLVATEEALRRLAQVLPAGLPVAPERAPAEAIARLVPPGAVHQGLALLADPLSPPPLAEALAASPGPVVVLDQVTDPRNVGAVLRSAAAFGAASVIVQDRHAPGESGAMARAAAGALDRIPLLRAVNLARTLEALKQAGLWVVGLEASAERTLASAGLGDRRLALVLGAEDEGMRRLTREGCDLLVRLPQTRAVESLNVSVAAAVALYAVQAPRLETLAA
ncbi:MAG: RNA methyltransferase [Elioraea sp.]|nr:RNA methyltransferase [Elioraea sp.]